MEDKTYKVLWIDDDESIHEAYQQLADLRGIDLVTFTNWEDAKPVFEADFDEWTAVILDAYCQLTPRPVLDQNFLNEVLNELKTKFAERRKLIPWYVLSAGTMSNFNGVINSINLRDRRELEQDWGKLVHLKDDIETGSLFDCICDVGERKKINTVLYRHKDVFKYVGANAIFGADARRILLESLSALYYPEETSGISYPNPLGQILEIVLRSMIEKGLLPQECLDGNGNPIVKNSCELLLGKEVLFSKSIIKLSSPYSSYYSFKLIPQIELMPQNMLSNKDFRNLGSHPNADKEIFVVSSETEEMFYSYLMQLCQIVKDMGMLIESHPDVEENKQNIKRVEFDGNSFLLEQDADGKTLHCGPIKVVSNKKNNINYKDLVGETVQIDRVKINDPTQIERYGFYTNSIRKVNT